MTKIDFKKQMKDLYRPPRGKFAVVEVPEMNYIMIDGQGDPNTAVVYQQAVEALYATSYKLKFMSKNELGKDYIVPPLEGLWSSGGMEGQLAAARDENEWLSRFAEADRNEWQWTMMIMQPDWIMAERFEQIRAKVEKAKGLPALEKMRFESYGDGLSVQVMHIGPYADEGSVLAKMHLDFIPNNGYAEIGKHHEIYLSDPRKTAPEKLKTVLRQPVKEIKDGT
jgi:hypothetical protein